VLSSLRVPMVTEPPRGEQGRPEQLVRRGLGRAGSTRLRIGPAAQVGFLGGGPILSIKASPCGSGGVVRKMTETRTTACAAGADARGPAKRSPAGVTDLTVLRSENTLLRNSHGVTGQYYQKGLQS
jgi:hypothetical protein